MLMRTGPQTIVVYGIGIFTLAVSVVVASRSGRPPDHFSRDPLAVMEGPFYVGLLSNLTMVAWFAAAGAGWMTAVVLQSSPRKDRRAWAMAAVAGMITLLGRDDLFMIHEEALQRMLGVPEMITVAIYGLMAAVVAMMFRRDLRASPWWLIIPVAMFFAASLAIDQFSTGFGWRPVIEDGLKFLGVVGILSYVLATGTVWLQARDVNDTVATSNGRPPRA
jgi:cytochrome bd-type quinol oxidase subunit 2